MEAQESFKNITHGLFEVTVFAKGISGVLEILSGAFLLFKRQTAARFMTAALNHSPGFSYSTQHFIAVYLLFYGAINIFLVVSLLRGRLWAYPVAIACFLIFTAYMFVRFLFNHSLVLSGFIVFDFFLIALTWLEYKRKITQV